MDDPRTIEELLREILKLQQLAFSPAGSPEDPAAAQRARQTLREAVAEYWSYRQGRVSQRTIESDRERAKPLLRALGDRVLAEITAADIAAFQQARVQQVSGRTVNMEVGLLRRILKRAKLWSRLADDVTHFSESSKIARVPTPEQLANLFRIAAGNSRWTAAYAAAEIASATTCRKVEIRHLRWRDVDFPNGVLHIATTKGRTAGVRLIPLNKSALGSFRRLLKKAKSRRMAKPDHFVFPITDAKTRRLDPTRPQPRDAWTSAWRSLTKAAGLKGLRFHDLRHTALTSLAELGVPETVLQALAGHRSPEMTRHYVHIRLPALKEAVKKLSIKPPRKTVQSEKPKDKKRTA